MSEWITDRRPTAEDAHDLGYVWVTTEHGNVLRQLWNQIGDRPWMPTARPEPYVKPKRWTVDALRDTISGTTWYEVWDNLQETSVAVQIPTRKAAERIAAIYEEVLP